MSNQRLTVLTKGQLRALEAIRTGEPPNWTAVKSLVQMGLVRVEVVGDVTRAGWSRSYEIVALDAAE